MSKDPLIGRVVGGKYHVINLAAEEALGRVYTATKDGETAVRVKVLHAQHGGDIEGEGRFGREMLATGAVSHPNTIKMIDFGQDGVYSFYVTEHLAGRSLTEEMGDGALPMERAVHIAAQIAAAMAAVHDKSIVHRNLTGDVVLLLDNADDDYVKVTDFGLSWLEDYRAADDGRITMIEDQIGNVATRAPEYIHDRIIGPSGDLYAIGILLFEMLTGQHPFAGNYGQILVAHTDMIPPTLAECGVDAPAWLEALVAQLLAKTPNQRPDNARAVVKALEEGIGHSLERPPLHTNPGVGDLVAAPATPRDDRVKRIERDKRPWFVGGMGLGALVVLFGLWLALG